MWLSLLNVCFLKEYRVAHVALSEHVSSDTYTVKFNDGVVKKVKATKVKSSKKEVWSTI